MEHLVCALFEDEGHATEGVEDLLNSGVERSVIGAVMHSGHLVHEDVPYAGDQSFRRGAAGAALGGGIGALLGAIVAGPIGLVGAGSVAVVTFLAGSMYGAIAGALTGRDAEKPRLQDIASHMEEGEVLVTVDVSGELDTDRVQAILRHAGAREVQLA